MRYIIYYQCVVIISMMRVTNEILYNKFMTNCAIYQSDKAFKDGLRSSTV